MNKNTLVAGLLFVAIFVVGFLLGRFTAPGAEGGALNAVFNQGAQETRDTASNTQTSNRSGESFTISTSNLSQGQRDALRAVGIEGDTITLTSEMIICAEGKIGAGRVEEIKNGASPSMTEAVSLMACYH